MYNHAPDNYVCPFCLLVQGVKNTHVHSVQFDIIYHNTAITAFIGSHQYPNNHETSSSFLMRISRISTTCLSTMQ